MLELARHPRVKVVKYEDLVETPGSTMEYVVKAVGGRDFDPSLRLASYAKESYTGDRIDPSRNPQPDELLTAKERADIRRRFDLVFSTFQYE